MLRRRNRNVLNRNVMAKTDVDSLQCLGPWGYLESIGRKPKAFSSLNTLLVWLHPQCRIKVDWLATHTQALSR
jgi:hypothetical protein